MSYKRTFLVSLVALAPSGCSLLGNQRPVEPPVQPWEDALPVSVLESIASDAASQRPAPSADVAQLSSAVAPFAYTLDLYLNDGGRVWVLPEGRSINVLPPFRELSGEYVQEIEAPAHGSPNRRTRSYSDLRGRVSGNDCVFGEETLTGSCRGIALRTPVHEFAHVLQYVLKNHTDDFNARIGRAFRAAAGRDVFLNEYSRTDCWEYFAEGVVAYLNDVSLPYFERPKPVPTLPDDAALQGISTDYVTRDELRFKDPGLYSVVEDAFERVRTVWRVEANEGRLPVRGCVVASRLCRR